MLEGNPFADLVPSGQPGIIYGPPEVPKPEKPNLPVGYEMGPDGVARRITGLPPEKDGQGSSEAKVAETKAAFLASNLMVASSELNRAIGIDPKAARPTWNQWAAGLAGDTARGAANTPARRQAEAAQRGILEAALTLGTGAAYNKEQLEGYREQYFPTVTDDPETIAAKGRMLRGLLVNARIAAGGAAPKIDEALATLGLNDPVFADGGSPVPAEQGQGVQGKRLTPEQEAEYKVFLRGKPSAGELNSWWQARGFPGLANAEEVAEGLRTGKPVDPGIDYSQVDEAAEAEARARMEAEDKLGFTQPGPKERLATQGMTLGLSDEASGVGTALSHLLTGQNPVEGYRLGRDVERLRLRDAREQTGGVGTAIEIGGGFLSANPSSIIAPATNALATIGQGARAGAYGGALAGFGYGEGFSDSAEKAALGGALGAGLGGGISALSTRLSPRGMAPELAAASEAENVRLIRPMFDEASRNKLSALETAPGSAPIIQEGVREVSGDIERGVQRLAQGESLETGAAGERVQGAARRFIQRSKGVANRLYARARNLSSDYAIHPVNAIEQADAELATLMQNPETNAAEIAFINRIKNDLSDENGKSVDALRGIRTTLRGAVNEANLTSTQAEARVHRILDAAHRDLNVLPSAAATAFRRADMFYRERMEHIDDVTRRFLGPKDSPLSGEQAFARLKSMASPGGDGRRLAAMWRDLEPQEQADVASTIAQSLGRRGADDPFSTALFISQVRKFSPSSRRTIFGPSGAESVNNLVTLSRALEGATSKINRSNTARSLMQDGMRNFALALLTGGVGGGTTGSVTTGALAAGGTLGLLAARTGGKMLSARALMSPRVSRWLAELPNVSSPAQAENMTRKLGVIIAREPALAGELAPIQQMLTSQMRPMPVAASEPVEGEQQ